jgi:decaprenyl-phosphate phosphoribosyltransferase
MRLDLPQMAAFPRRRSEISSIEAVAREEQVRLRRREDARRRAPSRPREGHAQRAGALLAACRPRQWSKNLLVLAAPSAAGVLGHTQLIGRIALAFLSLCLLSSATYLLNDVRDRAQDRLHPVKRARPVAAGRLSPASAVNLAVLLAIAGLGSAAVVSLELTGLALLYLALTVSYSLWLRNLVVIDMLAIAVGFVLRALAGGVATGVYLSRWFVIVTACCAVFLIAAKRYAELCSTPLGASARATLARYSPVGLRLTLMLAGGLAVIAYLSWALTRTSHVTLDVLSAAPFLAWLVRYSVLIGEGAGEAPEELVVRDRTLLVLSAGWIALFLGGVYAGN